MINLIATPERYDGKLVFLTGYVTIGLEHMTVCPSKSPLSGKDCLWLEIDDGPFIDRSDVMREKSKEKIWMQFDGKVVSIRGVFDKDETGHFGQFSGAIRDVVDVYCSSEKKHVSFRGFPTGRGKSPGN